MGDGAWELEGLVEIAFFVWRGERFGWEDGGDRRGRVSDIERELEWGGEMFQPEMAEGMVGETEMQFFEWVSERAWMVAMGLCGSPKGFLSSQCFGYLGVGKCVRNRGRGQSGESCLMGEKVLDGERSFIFLTEFGPDIGDGGGYGDVKVLEQEEERSAGGAFGCGPTGDMGIFGPGNGFGAIFIPVSERKDRLIFIMDAK